MMAFDSPAPQPSQPRARQTFDSDPVPVNENAHSSGAFDPADPVHAHVWAHYIDDLDIRQAPPSVAAPARPSYADAQAALQAAADVVQNERAAMIGDAPAPYQPALRSLYEAMRGKRADRSLNGTERVAALDAATAGLAAAIAMVKREDPAWLDDNLMPQLADLRQQVRYIEARERVDNAVRIGERAIIELPGDDQPREQGKLLHAELPKLIATIGMLNEQIIRLNHDAIDREAEALLEGKQTPKLGPGALMHVQNILLLASGWLTLSDAELSSRLGEINSILGAISSYSELVKGVVEFTAGSIGVTVAYGAALAKLAGDEGLFSSLSGFAKTAGLKLGKVIAIIEIVHGIFVFFDSKATAQEKADGAAGAASAAAWWIGKRLGGAAVGFAASTAALVGYGELKLLANLYWQSALGLNVGLFRVALETVQRDANAIARAADALAKAGLLRQQETDPEKARALRRVEANLAIELGEDVDELIQDLEPEGFSAGVARNPGEWEILREAFAPVKQYKGARTPETAALASKIALERITWVFAHAGDLVVASAGHEHLSDVEAELASRERNGKAP